MESANNSRELHHLVAPLLKAPIDVCKRNVKLKPLIHRNVLQHQTLVHQLQEVVQGVTLRAQELLHALRTRCEGDIARHKGLQEEVDVLRGGYARGGVDRPRIHGPCMAHGGRLEDVEHLPHVAIADLHNGFCAIVCELELLHLRHVAEPADDLLLTERRETKLRATRLQRGNDLAAVVADEDEASVRCILLDHAAQRKLRRVRHVVCLI
mmetsp:Transcript_94690/g.203313  ORF Transcript_94690/g.203313 Transcript_94690/m.203313 type:complete len:210 (+) Transcript_94690:92-721(+)